MSNAAPEKTAGPVARAWRQVRSRWWLRWPMDLAILGLLLWGVGRFQARNLLSDGSPASDFTLSDLDGVVHTLSNYRGKTVVLMFWAPWCTVCSLESDNWARIKRWKPNVEVLPIALSYADRAEVEAFVGADRGAYPVLLGTEATRAAYRVESFPTHYIIAPDGTIAWQSTGYTPTLNL